MRGGGDAGRVQRPQQLQVHQRGQVRDHAALQQLQQPHVGPAVRPRTCRPHCGVQVPALQDPLQQQQASQLRQVRGRVQLHEQLVRGCLAPPGPGQLLIITCRYGGECGRVGYDWCANGDDFVAGTLQAGPGRSQVSSYTVSSYTHLFNQCS